MDLFKDYFVAAAFDGQCNIFHRETKKIQGAFGYLMWASWVSVSVPEVYWEQFSPLIVEHMTNKYPLYAIVYNIRYV